MATNRGGDYPTGCLLDYPCFEEQYKLKVIDLSKNQALGADMNSVLIWRWSELCWKYISR